MLGFFVLCEANLCRSASMMRQGAGPAEKNTAEGEKPGLFSFAGAKELTRDSSQQKVDSTNSKQYNKGVMEGAI